MYLTFFSVLKPFFSKVLMLIYFCVSFSLHCAADAGENNIVPPGKGEFAGYWYAGKAELTRYKLEQARYGEIHKGDAVLIFVTEDFLTDKQVKYEYGDRGNNVESVLKLNFTRQFNTGIYPYSMIFSAFTPVDYSKATLKVAASSQEWCGHTFSQLNYRDAQYQGVLYSYFQAEGDQTFTLDGAFLEDEIWAKIRLNPAGLPSGDIKIIPGSHFLRLRHRNIRVENAEASLKLADDPQLSAKPLNVYRIKYNDFNRVLEITFETEFPYTIVAWEEQTESGFRNPKILITRAVRTHSLNSAYWGQHSVADSSLRKKLGL